MCHIARDKQLNIIPCEHTPEYRGKNDQFLAKMRVMAQQEYGDQKFGAKLYLDADTTVHGPLDELFQPLEGSYGKQFVATQFCNWTTNSNLIRNRIRPLLDRESGMPKDLIYKCLNESVTSVNGGIWACRPETYLLPLWYRWTWDARKVFIADEAVLHILCLFDQTNIVTLHGGKFNYSYKFLNFDLVRPHIVHYHGNGCVRPKKNPKGHNAWRRIYNACVHGNVGYLRDWQTRCPNKYLNECNIDKDKSGCFYLSEPKK